MNTEYGGKGHKAVFIYWTNAALITLNINDRWLLNIANCLFGRQNCSASQTSARVDDSLLHLLGTVCRIQYRCEYCRKYWDRVFTEHSKSNK